VKVKARCTLTGKLPLGGLRFGPIASM